MLQLKTSGKVNATGKQYNPVNTATKEALNKKTLAEAVAAGIIKNDDKLRFSMITGTGKNGDYELLVLGTSEGDIQLSSTLAQGGIAEHVETLGDLVFNIGISTIEGAGKGLEYFRLQAPGNYNQVRTDVNVADMASA